MFHYNSLYFLSYSRIYKLIPFKVYVSVIACKKKELNSSLVWSNRRFVKNQYRIPQRVVSRRLIALAQIGHGRPRGQFEAA